MKNRTLDVWIRLAMALGLIGFWTGLPASETPGQEIAVPAPVGSRQHQLTTDKNGRLLLSWVEGSETEPRFRFALREGERWSEPRTIAAERRHLAAAPLLIGLGDGALAAAWMTHTDQAKDRFAATINLSRSTDGGLHWSRPRQPSPRKADVYDAQMSLVALADGESALVWTDKRNQKPAKRYQLMATVIDGSGKPGPELTVDADVCSCCETGMAAQGKDWLVAYRDHLPGEVRDIALARRRDGKLTHRGVHEDHWVIQGCPSNGPAVAWRGSRALVAWFAAADGTGRVKTAFSSDDGKTFGPPLEVDADANGYVDALFLDDGSGLVAWRGRVGPQDELRVARVRSDGRIEDRATLYRGDFPRWPSRHLSLARSGDDTYVAWTDPAGPRVRVAKLPAADSAHAAAAAVPANPGRPPETP